MNRRHLLTGMISLPATAQIARLGAASNLPRAWYELRWFSLRNGSHAPRMMQLLRDHWAPAAKRVGIQSAGFFQPTIGDQNPSVLMLSVFQSPDEAAGAWDKLHRDDEFAAAYQAAQSPEPAFERMDVTLLHAFEGMPAAVTPEPLPGNAAHIFELRTYESNSMVSLRTKLEMFNGGEIQIFQRLGMAPVFFGEGVFGRNLPSLTYMLSFRNLAERERLWSAFVADAEFTRLRTKPGYSDPDIVSTISNAILQPMAFSQIR
jgi:hypothetical protein